MYFRVASQDRGAEAGKTAGRLGVTEAEGSGLGGGDAAAAELTGAAGKITANVRREDERKGGFD